MKKETKMSRLANTKNEQVCSLSHNELASSLARHLIHDGRMVWEDIPAGRSGSVRPDVYTIEKSFANPNPIAYEVKVSRADFRSDVTKAKWKAYLDFSYGVVFAVPKGLVTKKDIPNGCGLITFNGQFWNTVKKPTLHPSKLDDELLLKLLIGGQRRQSAPEVIAPRPFDERQHHETLRKKFGQDIAQKLHFIERYPAMKEELTMMRNDLGKLFDEEIDGWSFEWAVRRHIDKLKALADETTRKALIVKELTRTQCNVQREFENIIRQYTQ